MEAQKRKTTLQKRYRYGDGKVVPELRLSGVWLEEMGFTGGHKGDVNISRGKLVITASNGYIDHGQPGAAAVYGSRLPRHGTGRYQADGSRPPARDAEDHADWQDGKSVPPYPGPVQRHPVRTAGRAFIGDTGSHGIRGYGI